LRQHNRPRTEIGRSLWRLGIPSCRLPCSRRCSCASVTDDRAWEPQLSCGAGAWERAPTPADMLASAHMLAVLCITERRSREPSRPCFALGIVIFQPLVVALCAANRLAHVLLCKSTHEAAP